MKPQKEILFVMAISTIVSACQSPTLAQEANSGPVPYDVIEELPKRIQSLSASEPLAASDVMKNLGLERHAEKLAGSLVGDSCILVLDEDHVIQLRGDFGRHRVRKADIDILLGGLDCPVTGLSLAWDAHKVYGCTLRRHWNEVLAHRMIVRTQ
jgi:hypothetical protein